MLQLQTNKYRNTYNNQYYYGGSSERIACGNRNVRLQNHTYYFRGPNPVYHADLPLHMNNIRLNRYYFEYDNDNNENTEDTIETIKNVLLNLFNNTDDNDCTFVTCYIADNSLENKDYQYSFIDNDLWKEHKGDAIESLYNKCVEQTSLRESERQERNIKQRIRIFQSKSKHIILMLTDYADTDQESETFLTLGLTPILFEDWKEKFCQEEIDYFKCLVNRSQVKRISNVKPLNLFRLIEGLEKYHVLEREIRYQTLFQKVAEARVRNVENQTRQLQDTMDRAMRDYDNALKKITEYDILINKYREDAASIVEELQTISKAKGVYDIENSSNGLLRIILRVPLDYFDEDEAECAIRNIGNADVRRFINEIFIEQKYKLMVRVDAYYSYTPESNFQDFTTISEDNCIAINAMFNPHFQFYHCLGDYRPTLIKAMREQDLCMFTNIAIAASRSMNFKDGAVCNRWFSWLANTFEQQYDYYLNMKCLEKDGHLYTLGQWLHNDFNEEIPQVNVIEAEDL